MTIFCPSVWTLQQQNDHFLPQIQVQVVQRLLLPPQMVLLHKLWPYAVVNDNKDNLVFFLKSVINLSASMQLQFSVGKMCQCIEKYDFYWGETVISMKSTCEKSCGCVHHRQAQVVDPTLPLPPSSNRFDQDNSCLDQFSRWSIQLILFTFRFQSFCVSSILVIITVSREMKVIDSELIFNICDIYCMDAAHLEDIQNNEWYI